MIKRIIDLAGAALGLVAGLPFMGIAALAIFLEDRGPIFFCQVRTGERGKPFRMYKLRSMRVGAELEVDDIPAENPGEDLVIKTHRDPRITRVGRILRRWSIDEIPQFINVLKGEMSLVGPRPEEARIVSRYAPAERLRLSVKPGLTGPMQVNGRANLNFSQRSRLELDYINNWSIWTDLKILFLTIGAVLNGRGSY